MTTSLALRYSFNVPRFAGKKHMLAGYDLQHVALLSRVDADEFFDPKDAFFTEFGGDVNKLAAIWMDGARKRIQKTYNLSDEEMKLVTFRGLSTCRHGVTEKVDANDPRWV